MFGVVERKRRDESRWNDSGLDQFETPVVSSGLFGISIGVRGMSSTTAMSPSTSYSSTTLRWESSRSSTQCH